MIQELEELKELADSLEWFELETEEQEILTNLECSISLIHQLPGSGMYQTCLTDEAEWGAYSHAIQADTIDGLENMISQHYTQAIKTLAAKQNK